MKNRIIDTSLQLFEKHGFHGVSVNQIVQESGTSKGGFYHHFHSKDELLFVIHDYFISYVLNKAMEAISTSTHPTEKMQKMITSFVKVFDLYKPHISVFYQESGYLKPLYASAIKEKREKYKTLLFNLLEEGVAAGEFRPELDRTITGMSILGMVNWSYKWYKREGEKSIEEIAEIYVDLILHGLLTTEAKQDSRYARYFLNNKALT